ncbi:MAG: PAS domain-containing sensor histidine kinase [Bifidobacteriaceae bacterium]|jgi:two-component sensor histidine kinase|nr:PAS domain-containing sensor histidine kinase [Bifidobacteriaceae bacterium]
MPSFASIAERMADLLPGEQEWIRRLVAEWQVVADLAFADLVAWLPTTTGSFVAAALCRPGTGSTIYHEDVVGMVAGSGQQADFREVLDTGVIRRHHDPRWHGSFGVREEVIPVVMKGKAVGVVTRHGNIGVLRNPSRLETNYVELADELVGMIARGEFPPASAPSGSARHMPRVGDGILRLNTQGQVLFASPNALSAFHRAGVIADLGGALLVEVLADCVHGPGHVDETLPVVAMGRAPWISEIELGGVSMVLRSVPLTNRGNRTGALVLCRDVTDLRRSEMELMTKDATIREIHHRVKNNLQEVSALLRMQARRSSIPEVKTALGDAIRRVSTIATVHETLSQTIAQSVDFDSVFGRTLRLAADAASTGIPVHTVQEGSFGDVPGDDATVLAIVLTELVTNAVEHGLAPAGGGTVWIKAQRDGDALAVTIADNGVGMPAGGTGTVEGLGTQIVRTFATGELRGSITWQPRPGGGTRATVTAKLRQAGNGEARHN